MTGKEHLEFYDVQVDVPIPEGGWQLNTWYHVYAGIGGLIVRTELLPPILKVGRIGTFRTKSDGTVRRFKIDANGWHQWIEPG